MTIPTRPPFILAIAADGQGCGFHRIMTPLGSLAETGVIDARIDMTIWPDHVVAATKPDVVIWQRMIEDGQIEAMERWRAILPNALFVYELDDYMGEIPAASFHSSFMPPDMDKRIARAIALCDRVTTTTEPLKEWLESLGAKEVYVVPNGLPKMRLHEREQRKTGKLRVGFAGGMSHGGDLEIIKHAMLTIGDKVEWVFMGMQPEGLPADFPVEFIEGVPALNYLDKMATMNIDLMLAPLEDNPFNRCKSNLRLVEAGAIGACVIAQDLPPYHVNEPPVWSYASTPDDWCAMIQNFINTPAGTRQKMADRLRHWVGKHYTLERILPARIDAWLPGLVTWKPALPRNRVEPLVIACVEPGAELVERMPFFKGARKHDGGLVSACVAALGLGADVLWLRPTTTVTQDAWESMKDALVTTVASVVPLSSDGFPAPDRWLPIPPASVQVLSDAAMALMEGRQLNVKAPAGAAVLLSHAALGMIGTPDVEGCGGNEEQALMEWGLRAVGRQWKHLQALGGFAASMMPPMQPTEQMVIRVQGRGLAATFQQTQAESLTAQEREDLELRLLSAQWGGPRVGQMGFDNSYESWLLLTRTKRGQMHPSLDIVLVREFDATPDWTDDQWVIFVDDTVTLDSHAISAFELRVAICADSVSVIYSDTESQIGDKRFPEFKPDFDRELFLAQDYVTPVCAVRGSCLKQTPVNRTALYTHLLEFASLPYPADFFHHIPEILGTMKIDATPEKAAIETLSRHMAIEDIMGPHGARVVPHKHILGCLIVTHDWRKVWTEAPKVSIVVPTLGSGRLIQPCVATILQHTAYPNYEVIVVQNGERQAPELNATILKDPRVKVVRWESDTFNWSEINNEAIRDHATGEYIVTMNDDVCVCTKGWLDAMMGHMTYSDVGVVGARLLHPAGFVQHIGVVCHEGTAGHMHKMLPNGQPGHLGRAMLTHESSAVTGACMLFSRETFEDVNGFDENLSHNYNDTAFCLAVRKINRRIVTEMTAELLHPEGSTRVSPFTPEGARKLMDEGKVMARLCPGRDPYWNPNLMLVSVNGGLGVEGLNADRLAWTDFEAQPTAKRILLINDMPGKDGVVLPILSGGKIPFGADLSGFHIRLIAPNAMNVVPWDIRDPARLAEGLKALGIDGVILESLVGKAGAAPPVEALRCLAQLRPGVSVFVNSETTAPWANTSMFGGVDRDAWQAAYETLENTQQAAE